MLTPALFDSPFPDGSDPTLFKPSDWNRVSGLLSALFGTTDPTGALLYRDAAASNGAGWLEPVAAGQVLTSGGAAAAPAWSGVMQLRASGVTPSVLPGSPLQVSVNQAAFGAGSVLRFENVSTNALSALRVDFLAGDVPGNAYHYGSIQVRPPAAAGPQFDVGSGSLMDTVLMSAGAEILRLNRTTHAAAGPYFVMFGGTSNAFPAFKREAAELAFRLGDDAGYTGVRASRYAFGDPATAPLWSVTGGIIQALTGATPTSIDVGPVKVTSSAALTNKSAWITGALNHAAPFSFYMDVAMTGISGGSASAVYLTPTFSLAADSTDVAALRIPAPAVTLNAHALTNATSLLVEGTPTAGTNRRSMWVQAGKSQFDDVVQCNGLQINGSNVLTNKSIYVTGSINHANPAAFYMDSSLTGLSGGAGAFAQGMYFQPSFSLAGDFGVIASLWMQAPAITLNGHVVDTAATVYVTGEPTNGTNKFALLVNSGLSKFGGAVRMTALPAFSAGDKYVTIDANGNLHVSAVGPAS